MKNSAISSKSKYIMVKYYYVYKIIAQNEITIDYLPMTDMITDLLTKDIFEYLFLKHVTHMKLKYPLGSGNHKRKTLPINYIRKPFVKNYITKGIRKPT